MDYHIVKNTQADRASVEVGWFNEVPQAARLVIPFVGAEEPDADFIWPCDNQCRIISIRVSLPQSETG